ncbi:hypothetical protein LUZ63_000996 [Rhynchospora breviuscula]|uniref:KIB1-4 beta-propeller domain-containing protein n=1 Tax=Rhynchospora breviuscula TaxID=2022672 RepID=A0A9Q0HWM1_9POAL|nr:hypothetical protein LUZ63_000996 [Rhynchospora breviuscula]
MFPSNFFYQPWIIKCHGANKHTTTFIDPMKKTVEEKNIIEIKGKFCFGCIGEWLFLWDEQSKECFFLDLNSQLKVHLPSLPEEPSLPREKIHFTNFSLTSSPNHPNCAVILHTVKFDTENFEVQEHFFLCCQPHDARWNKVSLDLDKKIIGANSVILDGKLYTNGVCCVMVFDVLALLAGQVDARTISTPKLPQFPIKNMVDHNLVESCGRIYVVRLHHYCLGPINEIDIYCLDISSHEWLRVDSIGNRAFFLSNMSSVSVCATDVGVECNCIYYYTFGGGNEERIYKFCFDDHTMTFSITPTDENDRSRLCWFVPTRRPKRTIMGSSAQPTNVLNEVKADKVIMENKITDSVSGPWNDLPKDLVELLLPHLSSVDALRFFTVCKSWNLASDSIQKAKKWPWLMYQEKSDGTCKLLDPLNGKEYTTTVGLTSSVFPIRMLCSKDGWVIVLDAAKATFMVNPLNEDVVELPPLEGFDEDFCGITFTSIPTSPDCVVLAFCVDINGDIYIYKWHSGDEDWTFICDDKSPPMHTASKMNLVFFQGELYCLGERGERGVFNPVEETWRMLDKLRPVYMEDEVPNTGVEDCYLLELDGNLISVFKYNYSDNDIRIIKLDTEKMEWIPVKDLAGWTIFLDPRSSFAKPSPHKSWSNKIFFTAFYSSTIKTCATYCMESKRYDIHFCDTKKPIDCVWLEPNLIRKCLMDAPC